MYMIFVSMTKINQVYFFPIPCELDVETDGDCEEHDGEDTEDDHHGGGCGEGALS